LQQQAKQQPTRTSERHAFFRVHEKFFLFFLIFKHYFPVPWPCLYALSRLVRYSIMYRELRRGRGQTCFFLFLFYFFNFFFFQRIFSFYFKKSRLSLSLPSCSFLFFLPTDRPTAGNV
jgi:tryptophan-rich sensory protein